MTKLPLAGAGLLLAGFLLSGCGASSDAGTAEPSGAPATAPASSAPAPSSAATPAPSATAGGVGGAADPCQVLDTATVSRLTGVKVRDGSTQAVGSSVVCTWAAVGGTSKDAVVFSAQEGPLPAALGQVADQLKTQFNGTVSPLTVEGADDARLIVGTTSGLKVVDVLAAKDQRFYQVLAASPRNAEKHEDGAIKIAEALLKG